MQPFSILFYGTPQFAVPALEGLVNSPDRFIVRAVVTQPDRPAGRGGKTKPSPVKETALAHGIPVLQPGSIKKELPSFLSSVSHYGPFDVAVVAAFGQILPVQVLTLPKAGSINIHGSLLPRWRGAAPIHHAIMSGDAETGVGLMQMEAGLDTGPVFSARKISLGPSDTTGEVLERLSKLGAELLVEDLPKIIRGELKSTPQNPEQVTIASKITNEDAEIDWNRTAQEISRKIRAFNPAPGAFTHLNGQRVKIYACTTKSAASTNSGPPGGVALLDPRQLDVFTGSGVLSIEEAQIEGRKRLPIEEFLRGAPISKDGRFGR